MATSYDHLPPDVRAALDRDLTIDITTIGRQSGEPRRIEIWFMRHEGAIYITGTPGPRDWLANLRAEPAFTFHLKESATVDLPARATEVTDPAERRSLLVAEASSWYRDQTELDELVESAPMVRVTFD